MDRQKIFDTVAAHLLKQGAQARNSDGCAYRSPSGFRCAVGCLIPDNLYDENMEGKTVGALLEYNGAIAAHLGVDGGSDLGLLEDLQHIHDEVPVAEWDGYLRGLAHREGLTFRASA